MNESAQPRSVVVGVDGSKAALRAALWAVDEAVSRDATLRLVGAVEPGEVPDATERAERVERVERAVNHAITAIQAAGAPPKMETRVTDGPAARSLIRASASAALLCVGAVGLRHFQPGRVGSTAAAVATSAHCPVAIVRAQQPRLPSGPAAAIVVELGGAAESEDAEIVLGAAVDEARLRDAALHAVVRGRADDIAGAAGQGDRSALADLDRRLARWTRRYPDLRVESAVARGGLLDYVAGHRPVQLAIVGSRNRQRLAELVGPAGTAGLQDAGCSLLVVNRRHL
ncbi:universal stress protein [Mycobacterium sp. HUMS_1102779]|uniref:universal stress protein n=1 Tax=Mycobacterium sp. HUMS_1102779 TaxID=3383487 RepID=UPI00389A360E